MPNTKDKENVYWLTLGFIVGAVSVFGIIVAFWEIV